MDQRRGRLGIVAVAVAAATVVATLAGCQGGDAASQAAPASPPGSATAPSTPMSDASVPDPEESETAGRPPAPEVPPTRKGPRGQKAFARYVMAAWAWSLRTNDAGPLLEVSRSRKQPCKGCRPLKKELAQRAEDGWYVDLPALSVERTRLRRDGAEVLATSKVDIPESDSFFEDGSFRSTNPAHPDATFVVRMRLVKGEYTLVSFTVS